ncbi:MAG TPA: DEAD/DEAH box helicase [Polyangiaceae bacterium]|nr:DEAD/DEAH box helicase [Polyangiaceae bacterium]
MSAALGFPSAQNFSNFAPSTAVLSATETTTAPEPRPGSFTPRLVLFAERVLRAADDSELVLPLIKLTFDYGGVEVRAADRRDRFFVFTERGTELVARNRGDEAQAQCVLESFGAVELECADQYLAPFDCDADYVVHPEENVHAWCSFSAHALPRLRALGWDVSIDPDYPYRVVGPNSALIASIEPEEEEGDWFSLELGIDVSGQRISILPALLEILEQCSEESGLDSLLRTPARLRALPLGNNLYYTLPPERLRAVVKIVHELYTGEAKLDPALRFPRQRAGFVVDLEAACGKETPLIWRGATHVRDHGVRVSTPPPPPVCEGIGLKATLRPYQEQGVAWLQHLRELETGGVLADDMGLGKTLQTIAHLVLEKRSRRADRPSLIVAPTSLLGNWRREIEKFAQGLSVCTWHGGDRQSKLAEARRADVVLTTYGLLCRDFHKLVEIEFHYLILDEAQAIKNGQSQANHAAGGIHARHRLCLSGTPVENNLDELFSLFDFLTPGFLGSRQAFREKFRLPIERGGGKDELEALRHVVGPFILRRLKEEVARELPPKTEIVRPIELEGDQRELYESIRVAAHGDVRKAIRQKGIMSSTITILDALMKLRQVCCDPRLCAVPSARRVTGSAKYEAFFTLLEKQLEQGRRVLVFSQFRRMLALLGRGMEERGIAHVELAGDTADRQKPIDAFERGEADVFLISLKAGGTGLNLVSADTVIHYDPWWNAAAQAQATDRAYRIGQTKPVFVHSLIASGSVEERMLRLQQRKQQIARALLSGGAEQQPTLTPEEVEDLFAPLGD